MILGADEEFAKRLIEVIEKQGWPCQWARVDIQQALLEHLHLPCDLILGDFSASAIDGLAAVRLLQEQNTLTPFLLVTSGEAGNPPFEALQIGTTEVVERDHLQRLPAAVERALAQVRLQAENRRLELALCDAEQKVHTLLEHALDAILVVQRATGTILRANRAAFLQLGYDEEDLIGRHFSRIFPASAPMAPEELLARLPVLASQPFLRADGTLYSMDVSAALLPWGTGRAVVINLRETGARDTAEEGLALNSFVADHIRELVFWSRPDGRICRVNRQACARLGYRQEELLAMRLPEIEPGLGPAVWPIHWEEVKSFGSFTLRATLQAKNGTGVPVEAAVHYLRRGGEEYHCAIARDAEKAARPGKAVS